MKQKISLGLFGLLMLSAAGAQAAVCTTNAGAGTWGTAATWSCGHVPLATDTVVITRNISLGANRTVAGVTVNAGATLSGGNRNLTVSGPVVVDGIYNTGGGDLNTTVGGALTVNTGGTFNFNNGNAAISGNVAIDGTLTSGGDNMQMTGVNTTLSGTGNVANTTIEIDAAGVSVPAGANLVFDANSEIDVGANNPGSLTVNGTIDGTAQAAGDRIIRVSSGGALTVGTTGVVNAPNSRLDVRTNATATNNGTITIGDLRGRTGAPAPVFTQGANSTLNINLAACSATGPCTFNASAAGNTVNYGGAAQTVITPSGATYANLTLGGSGAKTVPTGLTVAENFTMSGTATTTAPAALTVGGDFTIGAGNTFTPGAGTVTLNGTAAQTISGPSPLNFNDLTVTNGANPNIALATNVTVAGTLTGIVNLTSTCPTDYTLTSNGGATVAHSCSAAPDHLVIQSSATGLTCAANTLTIQACQDAGCATPYTGGVSGTLSATGAPTVNWDGTTGGAAGAGFVIPNGSSSVTKNVQVATAGSVVFGITSPAPVPTNATACNFGAPACTFTADTAGFVFSDTTTGSAYTIPAQVSGIATPTLYLRALQAATNNPAVCTPAIIGQTTAVNMGYVCNNPAACQAGNLAAINATAIAPGGTAVSLNFDANGSAPITARYDDVGRVTLNASKTVTPPNGTPVTLTGSSNPFVVAPHHFDFSNITPGLIKASNPFSATVTAYNGLATPMATPNFGKESVAEGVTLSPNLGAGNNPAISNNVIPGSEFGAGGMVNDVDGVATVNNLSWGEVGLITITANLTSGNYLGSALTATGTSANVGRFIPDHFDTAVVLSGGVPMPCLAGINPATSLVWVCPVSNDAQDGFVYSGQSFTTNVYARNLAGVPTLNYDSALGFSKAVTLTAWDAAGGATTNPSGGALTANNILSTSFGLGSAVTSTPVYTFGAAQTAPTDIYVRAVDTDSVTRCAPFRLRVA